MVQANVGHSGAFPRGVATPVTIRDDNLLTSLLTSGWPFAIEGDQQQELIMSILYDKTLELSNAFRREAKALDDAFLKTADARAVQGGAICEEANNARTIARQLRELACHVEDAGL